TKVADYLASTSPNYYGTTAKFDDQSGTCNTAMDKILTQKYIAQFQECSFETWADHRQFHKPTLMPFASVSSS
ncbi:SusD/RagB family nutrient-binding outer membrane lipoprotein, partial [Klebsiella pneumoniae]|nr:SusD/RagB family nutrient-binding outer membrane lipoprotein [Klebsiella pneumoniae]